MRRLQASLPRVRARRSRTSQQPRPPSSRTRGYGEWSGPRTGHGIGADVHEAPSVVEGNTALLEPGNVITIEPGVYMPDKWGIRIEDTVVITDGEPNIVTRGSRPLHFTPS